MSGMLKPQDASPPNVGFDYWFDGQPLVGDVDGNNMDYWADGQPIVEDGV